MIKKRTTVCLMFVLLVAFLAGCSLNAAVTVIEIEMTGSYDDSDPYINEKLFYVSDNGKRIHFEISFRMECESGLLEIADNETKEVVWSRTWKESADDKFNISLDNLDKEKEYVIRLTCTKVKDVKLVLTSDSSLVKEHEEPQKPDRSR